MVIIVQERKKERRQRLIKCTATDYIIYNIYITLHIYNKKEPHMVEYKGSVHYIQEGTELGNLNKRVYLWNGATAGGGSTEMLKAGSLRYV